MARNAGTRAGDFTGRQKEELAAKAAAEQAAKAKNLSMVTAQMAEEAATEPIDVKTAEEIAEENRVDPETLVGDIEVESLKEPKIRCRVNEDLEQVTFGYGNTYDLKMGQEYKIPKSLYEHLDSKGLIWH